MPVDASVISQIPTLAGNPMDSVGQGMTLASMVDQDQLTKLKLSEARQSQAESAKAKGILSKSDISTPQGLMDASEKLNRAGLSGPAMDLLKTAQGQQKQQLELDEDKIKVLQASSDLMGPAALQIKQTLAQQGPAMARAQYAQLVSSLLPQLPASVQAKIPAQPPQNDQQFAQMLDGVINTSGQARQILSQRLAERKEDTAEKRESAYERSVDENIASKKQSDARKATASQSAEMSDDDANFAAQQYLAGDKSVFSGLGRGTQGAANILKMRKAVREQAQARGMTGADVAAKMAEFNSVVAEERKIGSIAGGVEYASAELDKFIPLAQKASAAVPRGTFVPYNQLVQKGEQSISDPALRRLYVNTQSVLNAYDVLAARGGTDASKREHNRQLLTTADSPEVYNTALDAIRQELAGAKGASSEARSSAAKSLSDSPSASKAADSGSTVSWNDLK